MSYSYIFIILHLLYVRIYFSDQQMVILTNMLNLQDKRFFYAHFAGEFLNLCESRKC